MIHARRTIAAVAAGALLASPIAVLTAGPASAVTEKHKFFRIAGADVDFSVEKDAAGFEVDVDIDDARPGSRWRVVLWHDGHRFHNRVHRAGRDGDVDVDEHRRNTSGADVFKVKVKKIGGAQEVRRIRMR